MLDDDDVTVEWSVVDREFPASAKSIVASFVVEGFARIRGSTVQTWREIIRLRSSIHQFAKTQQVQVEMEILLDGGRKGGVNGDDDASRRWKRKLKRHMKDSLANMRSRIEEEQQKKVAGLRDAEDKKRKMPFMKENRAGNDKE